MRTIAWGILVAALAWGSGCARPDWIEQTLVTVDVTGTWEGSVHTTAGYGSGHYTLNLEQRGPQVKGYMLQAGMGVGSRPGPIEGTVAGDVFSFRQTNTNRTAEMTVSGDEMTGEIRGAVGRGTVTLRRVDSSSRPSPEKP
jgi:hypothetical protein